MLTGAAFAPLYGCKMEKPAEKVKNWAGNLTYSTTNIAEPKTVEEVQEIIRSSSKIRALGTRHCFNKIADSDQKLLSTKYLNEISPINTESHTITVGAGIRYGEFCKQIHEQGYAIHNLASLPHISVAGACATATHGSGMANGNLADPSITISKFEGGEKKVVAVEQVK